MMNPYYHQIANYYDLLMTSGYFDHVLMSEIIHSIIKPRHRLLELGVGSGLMVQELLKLDNSYEITGIDISSAMLDIARERLPSSVSLLECDVTHMQLDHRFEAAVSSGGTWVLIESPEGLMVGTHLYSREEDLQGLRNVAVHLEPGSIFLLTVHAMHVDRELALRDGIVYSQKVERNDDHSLDRFSVQKTYSFHQDGKTLAEETLTLGFYRDTSFPRLFEEAGFRLLGMAADDKVFILEKQ